MPFSYSTAMERQRRGVFTEISRRPLLVTPSPEQIARIAAIPKAEYVSTVGEEPIFFPEDTRDMSIPRYKPGLYRPRTILDTLVQRVEEKFGDQPVNPNKEIMRGNVAIRATACSLDGPFVFNRVQIRSRWDSYWNPEKEVVSLEEIVDGKSDHGSKRVNVEPVNLQNPKRLYKIGGFPQTYLMYHATTLREELQAANQSLEGIFPVLIVYKIDAVKGDFSFRYHIYLGDMENPGEAVLGAFVLDQRFSYPIGSLPGDDKKYF